MVQKTPNPIDVHVGNRVRMRRMLVGLSQEKLGDSLKLTFQQVQKYEKGSNRISASRLYQIAQVLGVPVQFFFDDVPADRAQTAPGFSEPPEQPLMMDFLNSSEGLQLNKSFANIRSAAVRRRVVDLVKAIAGAEDEAARHSDNTPINS